MAARKRRAHVLGLDINPDRLRMARASAQQLGIQNVTFAQEDLREWTPPGRTSGAYALDVFRHMPVATGNKLLESIHANLGADGKFLLKDISTRPRYMLYFTYILDLLMSPGDRLSYRSSESWLRQLSQIGF